MKSRPRDEYVPFLLDGLRYPWVVVNDHAAETIASLGLKEVVPTVVNMLNEPDTTLPFPMKQGRGTIQAVRELVRVNHLGNCVLCHAPSSDRADLVRGATPIPGEALPAPATTPAYYERGGSFVRADVTYLRQDFSVVQPVETPGKWPVNQRFDYLVRVRPATKKDMDYQTLLAKEQKITGQKEALLFLLRDLTGKDRGTTYLDWLAEVPPSQRPKQSLSDKSAATGKEDWKDFLPGAKGGSSQNGNLRQQQMEKLARSIPRLTGTAQEKARKDLTNRLTALLGTELSDKLQDDLVEIRRAAARNLCREKRQDAHSWVITLLDDREDDVVQEARQRCLAWRSRTSAPSRVTARNLAPRQ